MITAKKFSLFLIILSLLSLIVSLNLGDTGANILSLFKSTPSKMSILNRIIIFDLRLPHCINAFATGGLLALAGTLMQVLLRNPLADPYILGVSGGASAFSLLAILSGMTSFLIQGMAFIGALFSALLVYLLNLSSGLRNSIKLLLTGVIIAAGWSALISLILVISPNQMLHGMLFWLLGDLDAAQTPWFGLFILIISGLLAFAWAPELNIFTLGSYKAQSLGINSNKLMLKLYLLSTLCTATAVCQAGNIGFIGLIVPHMIRALGFSDHRYLIPFSILTGGSLLTLADLLSRIVMPPQILPVGIITSLLGIPVFLYLLIRGNNHDQP